MPILSAQGESDARIAAWLLATTAVDCLRDPAQAASSEIALNNVYQLLEAARRNPFFGFESDSRRSDFSDIEPVFLSPVRERHVGDVRNALDEAIDAVTRGRSRDEVIASVESTIRGVTYPGRFQPPTEEQRSEAEAFFDVVLRRLIDAQ